jgi:hypothetical protein
VPFTERDLENLDPLKLDREIAALADAVQRWRRRLDRGEGQDEDPFWAGRWIAGRTAFQVVRDLPEADPLRKPLLAWVYRLAEQRIDRVAIARVASERYRTEHVVSEPERVRLPLSAVLHRALAEPGRRQAWLESFLGAGGDLGDAVATLWERRPEVAARMGLSAPDAIESPGPDVVARATDWLDRTEDMLEGYLEESIGSVVGVALGEAAAEGWSGRLLPRTILDYFREGDLLRDVDLDPGPLPRPHAPASTLRALARVGEAWVEATAPRDQPFVVAHDPYRLEGHTIGALFGALPATAPFARRALGVDASRLVDHGRILARVILLESRAAALRVILRPAAHAGRRALREAFEHHAIRAFHVPLRPEAAGTIFRLHADDPQRFAGLLLAFTRAARLQTGHDEDWYRNPRAIEQLRDEARVPALRTTTEEDLGRGADALIALLTRALG